VDIYSSYTYNIILVLHVPYVAYWYCFTMQDLLHALQIGVSGNNTFPFGLPIHVWGKISIWWDGTFYNDFVCWKKRKEKINYDDFANLKNLHARNDVYSSLNFMDFNLHWGNTVSILRCDFHYSPEKLKGCHQYLLCALPSPAGNTINKIIQEYTGVVCWFSFDPFPFMHALYAQSIHLY